MRIPVVGFDPSLRNWGIAESYLDLKTGVLDTPNLSVVHIQDDKTKQVRRNSKDLHIAEQLAKNVLLASRKAKAVFVEVPVGSKSARAMASYGVCVGVLGAIRAEGIPLIEVSPSEVKLAFTGRENATKEEMISTAVSLYPEANFPKHGGKISFAKAEHMADAIAAIHAGAVTPMFQSLMRLFSEV